MAGEQQATGREMKVGGVGIGNNGSVGGTQVPESEIRKVQQQAQGPIVRWDRFLPFRSLKVLLVENDDCTRHVVSALLRNCSYEVVAVANGVQAWRYLEDLNNHTDLILSEVVMPVISGISLLYKIMSHKTIKNIPVIMMSSHDSMGIVFKCLSRGAVDFLVKPIRKNELKNLWQHVWRRCQSSSGSGSESGTESRKTVRPKNHDIPDNSICSNRHDHGRNDSSSDEDDECESGAQSSWTKRAAEIGSPQPTEDDGNDAPDSTCAQVIHTKEEFVNGMENVNVPEESEDQQKQFGACEDQMLEQGISQYFLQENHTEGQNTLPELDFAGKQKAEFDQFNKDNQLVERISTMITSVNTIEASNAVTGFSYIDKIKLGLTEHPHLGLGSEKERYTCGPSLFKDSQNNSSVAVEAMQKNPSQSSSSQVQLASGFIEENNGNTSPKPENVVETPAPKNAGHNEQSNCTVQPLETEKVDDVAVVIQVQSRESQQVHVQHHHHYHHYHHHIHDVQHHPTLTNQDHCLFENPETVTAPCASSHAFTETGEGAAGNGSMNGSGSGSGSQHGSNGKDASQHGSNGQNVIVIPYASNEDGAAGNSTHGIDNIHIITNLSEEDQFLQREPSLTKLRQKRKERYFEKKVRIQGRKKVADQRTCECDAEVEDNNTMLDELAFADISSENVR